ncbi:ROK family protein [Paenibacillus aestuarii]|uniref:ROK family protein n=1 Tax=Paenibacillus aestuarii TaxID=516965 RepID=A0ABW0KDB3_9BACL|nr:ROK family protein [Paenibacillus aestuarii]
MTIDEYFLGIDIGGTKMLTALVDAQGRVLAKDQQPTLAAEGEHEVIRRLIDMIEALLSSVPNLQARSIQSLGIATAGILDMSTGTIVLSTNLGWRNVALGPILERRFGVPVRLINDASAAALGEWLVGAGKGTEDCVYVTVSTGIGGGVISGGRMLLGASNNAAEIGHISIDRNGPVCKCGNRGCVEVYAAGNSIARQAAEELRAGKLQTPLLADLAGQDPEKVTAKLVAEAASSGDPYSVSLLQKAGEALGVAMVTIIHLFNPEVIIFGGGVSQSGDVLFEPMRRTIQELGIEGMVKDVLITRSSLGVEAGAIGAALVWKYVNQADKENSLEN